MKIIVVIPNWNGADYISACLDSLQKQTIPHDVVVVDNGSTDGSLALIEKSFPEVQVVRHAENKGFSGGVNAGFRYALEKDYEAVAVFNNDAIADKNWLKHLSVRLQGDAKFGIVCCKQLRSDGKHIDAAGGAYSTWGMPFPRGRNSIDKGQYDTAEAVFSAPGGASIYSAQLLREVGLFDEAFFAYYEDDDLSFRARLHGWKIWYEPKAKIFHHVSGTSRRLGSFTRYHATKNFFLLYAKNMPGHLYWKYLPLFFLQTLYLAAGSIRHGAFIPYCRGFTRAMLLTPHIYRERRHIQRTRIVAPAAIEALLYRHRPPKVPKIKAVN